MFTHPYCLSDMQRHLCRHILLFVYVLQIKQFIQNLLFVFNHIIFHNTSWVAVIDI